MAGEGGVGRHHAREDAEEQQSPPITASFAQGCDLYLSPSSLRGRQTSEVSPSLFLPGAAARTHPAVGAEGAGRGARSEVLRRELLQKLLALLPQADLRGGEGGVAIEELRMNIGKVLRAALAAARPPYEQSVSPPAPREA